jgi:hypothetical protein
MLQNTRQTARRFLGTTLTGLLLLGGSSVLAAEAPPSEPLMPEPVPPEAEAAYQDLVGDRTRPVQLDEAVFTDISPLTVPEIGVALPEDQAH